MASTKPTAPKHQWPDFYAEYIVARERGKTPDEAANHAALGVRLSVKDAGVGFDPHTVAL